MIRRRHFTPQMRRRLAEIDDKTGLGEAVIEQQAAASRGRLAITDQQPEAVRALLNDFPHSSVADAYIMSGGKPKRARKVLETRHGKPL